MTVSVYICRLADTSQTCTYAARHSLLHGDLCLCLLLCRICLHSAKHRHWSAGIDCVCFQLICTDRINDITLRSNTAILCRYIDGRIPSKFFLQEKIAVPVSKHHRHLHALCVKCLSQCKHRRDSDSSTDQNRFSFLSRKSIAKRSDHRDLISFTHSRKLLCSFSCHTVNNAKLSSLRINLTDTDRSWKQSASLRTVHGNKLTRHSLCRNIIIPGELKPHAVDSLGNLTLAYDHRHTFLFLCHSCLHFCHNTAASRYRCILSRELICVLR